MWSGIVPELYKEGTCWRAGFDLDPLETTLPCCHQRLCSHQFNCQVAVEEAVWRQGLQAGVASHAHLSS